MNEIRTEKVHIDRLADIGRTICKVQAGLGEGESISITFIDGGSTAGNVTLTRVEDGPMFRVVGNIYPNSGNDRGVDVDFMSEPDGPVYLPISTRRKIKGKWVTRLYNADEESEFGEHERAAFYASGTSFTTANAPAIKAIPPGSRADSSAKVGRTLFNAAKSVEAVWGKKDNKALWANVQARKAKGEFGRGKAAQAIALQEFAKLQSLGEPETNVWPRKMPRPMRAFEMPVGVKSTARTEKTRIDSTTEAVTAVEAPVKRAGVIKRANRAA